MYRRIRSSAGGVGAALAALTLCVVLILVVPSGLSNPGFVPAPSGPPEAPREPEPAAEGAGGNGERSGEPLVERPNIVLVIVDDLDARLASRLSGLERLMAGEGVSLSRAFVSDPLCCPSRASILRGQYAHNHHVISTNSPHGGYRKFRPLESSTVATWLDGAGYRTALVGKYLNSYDTTAVPPGWDEWYALMGNFYDQDNPYRINAGGRERVHASGKRHDTDLLSRRAVDFVSRASREPAPFFLYLAPNAPHSPAPVAPRYENALPRARPAPVPSVGEGDVSDKPRWVRRQRARTAHAPSALRKAYRQRLRSMLSVEDMMRALIRRLQKTGELDETYVFFTSDNGYHLGEHRLGQGKRTPYEEDIRVPLYVRGPGVPRGEALDALTVNTDLAPTFADLAGTRPPGFVDGRSLVPLLSGPAPQNWRTAVLVEGWRAGTLNRAAGPIPTYQVLRTDSTSYIEYATGERELYRLRNDPYQLENRSREAAPGLLRRLQSRLEALRECAKEGCRAAENARGP